MRLGLLVGRSDTDGGFICRYSSSLQRRMTAISGSTGSHATVIVLSVRAVTVHVRRLSVSVVYLLSSVTHATNLIIHLIYGSPKINWL